MTASVQTSQPVADLIFGFGPSSVLAGKLVYLNLVLLKSKNFKVISLFRPTWAVVIGLLYRQPAPSGSRINNLANEKYEDRNEPAKETEN